MRERGAIESEVLATVESGERFAAPWGRTGFRKRFRVTTRGRACREVTAFAEAHDDVWLVVTAVVATVATGGGARPSRARQGRAA
jgi:hypothetical protein